MMLNKAEYSSLHFRAIDKSIAPILVFHAERSYCRPQALHILLRPRVVTSIAPIGKPGTYLETGNKSVSLF